MIDFRYHLVSIIAIFFALATGIILGAGPLDEQVDQTLVDQIPQLRDENQQLRDQIVALEADLAYEETFVDSSAPLLVADRLADRRVGSIGRASETSAYRAPIRYPMNAPIGPA